jgi:hypothetical protein
MDLKCLNDEKLLAETSRLVKEERELLTTILHHLREIERRRLFCGHPSLFAYAVKVLGYSEDQAYRRISAMRLLKELPAMGNKIAAGNINLTHIGLAHSVFQQERKQGRAFSTEKKAEFLSAIEGCSTREAQKVALRFQPEAPHRKDAIKPVGSGRNLAQIELSDETLAKIEKLKDLLAHQDPNMSMDRLIGKLCDLGLETWNPNRPLKRNGKAGSVAEIRRQVWRRDGGRCTVCGSTYALQVDHVHPVALGGRNNLDNLRLLCRSCNQRAAIEKLGLKVMDPFLSPAAPRVGLG